MAAKAPTVKEIVEDKLTQLSLEYWATGASAKKKPYDAKVIEKIYSEELHQLALPRIMLLELSLYLEHFLWPNYDAATASKAHALSIMIMVNEKFRGNIRPWEPFVAKPQQFSAFFHQVLDLTTQQKEKLSLTERTVCLHFLINSFQSLETEIVRKECLRLTSFPLWHSLNPLRLQKELSDNPGTAQRWKRFLKREADLEKAEASRHGKAPEPAAAAKGGRKRKGETTAAPTAAAPAESSKGPQYERTFLPSIVADFLNMLHQPMVEETIRYAERFIEFLVDLVSQLPTRRFVRVLLDDLHVVIKAKRSDLYSQPQGSLFRKLVEVLKFYQGFEINDHTGEALSDKDMLTQHYSQMSALQLVAFTDLQDSLRAFALSNVGSIDSRASLLKHLQALNDEQLHKLSERLALEKKETPLSREELLEIIVSAHEKRLSQLEAVNDLPLYPNEHLLWDDDVIPAQNYSGDSPLALPKLNLQFLTVHDYLLRNFNLYRLEAAYEIRQDIDDAVTRVSPQLAADNTVHFNGWARMALPVSDFRIITVAKAKVGEIKPAEVKAEVTLSLANFSKGPIRAEWESIKLHDVLFLLTVRVPKEKDEASNAHLKRSPADRAREQHGVVYCRGCEVYEVLDESKHPVDDRAPIESRRGHVRTFRVWLDSAQYQQDIIAMKEKGAEDPYKTFNLLMRRKPKENNFKSILETIRDLMNTKTVVPSWLHDVFLGYGDPAAAQPQHSEAHTLDYNDVFLSRQHLAESFPGWTMKFASEKAGEPPVRITFPSPSANKKELTVSHYEPPNQGPYPHSKPRRNTVPFTPVQIAALTSSLREGLTLIVGPPGTGKTDVAVQTVSNLYHNFPHQRILIVTHSNNALNQIFEKIAALDIDERHLLRLGQGAEGLKTEKDFSRYGRIDYMLALRLRLLDDVSKLAIAIGFVGDVGATCETAAQFYSLSLQPRWEEYKLRCMEEKTSECVIQQFPLHKFFEDAPQPLFPGKSFQEDLEIALGCWRHVEKIFVSLEDCRAFELLRTAVDRANYLLTKQARIIAMTCTHAALKRRELVQLGFRYDTLLMEEAAQVLEIETFIPMLLQNPELNETKSRLKRVVLIGDHNQLPPVVQNQSLQKYSHLDQSMFARFVRLGVPTIDLDLQGRCRPDLAALFNWRYKNLRNLPQVTALPEYKLANAGFRFDYQLIDVQDYAGRGESEPNPFFYQNLGEAEYVVACFQYMRLLGYAADRIVILTTYNGQKYLLRDVIAQRCAHPMFGRPKKVTTVDRFQGQQADFVLLSLVRTKAVGHLRDVRRLIVAMSRARLGLYVFCRRSLFENCYELTPAFSLLLKRPDKLQLVQKETVPTQRTVDQQVEGYTVNDITHMSNLLRQYWKDDSGAGNQPQLQIAQQPADGAATGEPQAMQT